MKIPVYIYISIFVMLSSYRAAAFNKEMQSLIQTANSKYFDSIILKLSRGYSFEFTKTADTLFYFLAYIDKNNINYPRCRILSSIDFLARQHNNDSLVEQSFQLLFNDIHFTSTPCANHHYFNYASYHFSKENYAKFFYFIEKAKSYTFSQGNNLNSRVEFMLYNYYHSLGNQSRSKYHLKAAYNYAQQFKDTITLSACQLSSINFTTLSDERIALLEEVLRLNKNYDFRNHINKALPMLLLEYVKTDNRQQVQRIKHIIDQNVRQKKFITNDIVYTYALYLEAKNQKNEKSAQVYLNNAINQYLNTNIEVSEYTNPLLQASLSQGNYTEALTILKHKVKHNVPINNKYKEDLINKYTYQNDLLHKSNQLNTMKLKVKESEVKVGYKNMLIVILLLALLSLALLWFWFRSRFALHSLLNDKLIKNIQHQNQHYLLQQIFNTENKERQRVAMELHDHITSLLFISNLKLSYSSDQPSDNDKIIDKMQNLIQKTRNLSHKLHPQLLDKGTLVQSIQHLVYLYNEHEEKIKFNHYSPNLILGSTQKASIIRLLQALFDELNHISSLRVIHLQLHNYNHLLSFTLECNKDEDIPNDKILNNIRELKTFNQRLAYLNANLEFDIDNPKLIILFLEIPVLQLA